MVTINKKVQRGIAKSIEVVGFKAVARDIRKAKTIGQVKKNVAFFIKSQNKSCSPRLMDPVTRKTSINPARKNCVKFAQRLRVATRFL